MDGFDRTPRFQQAMNAIDAANGEDPLSEDVQGRPVPRALLYSERMTAALHGLAPEATEAVHLAARCQHFQRWKVPRETYPAGRAGYHRWRTDLARLQAEWAGEVLREVGYSDDDVRRIQSLLRKERLREDPEAQLVEDTACLVFLCHYLMDFASNHPRAKVVAILRKTWRKMSDRAQAAAWRLALPPGVDELVADALSESIPEDTVRATPGKGWTATA